MSRGGFTKENPRVGGVVGARSMPLEASLRLQFARVPTRRLSPGYSSESHYEYLNQASSYHQFGHSNLDCVHLVLPPFSRIGINGILLGAVDERQVLRR